MKSVLIVKPFVEQPLRLLLKAFPGGSGLGMLQEQINLIAEAASSWLFSEAPLLQQVVTRASYSAACSLGLVYLTIESKSLPGFRVFMLHINKLTLRTNSNLCRFLELLLCMGCYCLIKKQLLSLQFSKILRACSCTPTLKGPP